MNDTLIQSFLSVAEEGSFCKAAEKIYVSQPNLSRNIARLEKELDTVPKVIPMWRRWQAVAAVALLVVVSSLTVWFWQSPSANYLEKQSAELNVMHDPDELAPGSITPAQPMALVVPAARSEEKKHVKVVRSVTAKALAAEQEVLLNKEVERNIKKRGRNGCEW